MPATTTRYLLQYPVSTDATNVPSGIETPLNEIDAIMASCYSGTTASRPVAGILGRFYYATDTGILWFDKGTAWASDGLINTAAGNITQLTPGNTGAAGSIGLAADAGHVHPLPAWGANSDYQAAQSAGSAGSTGRIADAGHVHPGDPAGIIKIFAGTTVPTGYVKCDGTSYPTATYPNLFNNIGYTWGGSGANFNVPNLVDVTPIGAGNIYNVGQRSTTSSVTLTSSMLPSHSHSINDPGHFHAAQPGFAVVVQTASSMNLQVGGTGTQVSSNVGNPNTDTKGTGISVNASPNPTQSVPVTGPVAGVLYIIRAY